MLLMYVPEQFALDATDTAHFLTTVVAGDLVTATDDGLVATFLPLLVDLDRGRNGSLLGHLARNNTQWQRPVHEEALMIAHGPDAYISLRGIRARPSTGVWCPPGTTPRRMCTATW
jgi:transcriptional regulator